VDARQIKSALMLVGSSRKGGEAEGAATELRNSAPNLAALALGNSGEAEPGGRNVRACAVFGMDGELH
jgi:hypothetical protein